MSLPPASPVHIRAAQPRDIPGIALIHEHYTLHTVITFKTTVTPAAEHLATLADVQSQRLPYLVAVPGRPASADAVAEGPVAQQHPQQQQQQEPDQVLGYTYCTGFRSDKAGYAHTVELSLFCAPAHVNRGVGTRLLTALLRALREPEACAELYGDEGWRGERERVRSVIACMAVDVEGREGGLGLKRWYERFGFVERGRLVEVGWKLGRWIDTMYLQKTLW